MSEVEARVPPHDTDAEAAILSVAMNGPTHMPRLAAMLTRQDFYSGAHGWIFEACVDLHRTGQPVDPVSVGTWLRDHGRLGQVGGVAYLTTVLNAAPALGGVLKYANTVRSKARVRATIAAAQRVAADGYAGGQEDSAFLAKTAADIQAATRLPSAEALVGNADALANIVRRIERARSLGTMVTGIPTGLDRFDRMTLGLHAKQLTVVAARPGQGKAQPIDAKVLTASGWKLMGDINVGDRVIGSDGRPTNVLGVYERGKLQVFRVALSDGGSTECCEDHLWYTRTRSERRRSLDGHVRRTGEIRDTLKRASDGGLNHSVPYAAPAHFDVAADLPIDPYALGALLGDGSLTRSTILFSNPEKDVRAAVAEALAAGDELLDLDGLNARIKRRIRANGVPSETMAAIRELGLDGARSETKFVPAMYLMAAIPDRIRLLQGLCDTDGHITDVSAKCVEYTTVSARLRDDVAFLARSLGGRVTWTETEPVCVVNGERHRGQLAYRIRLSFPLGSVCPVSSAKHRARWDSRQHRLPERFIKSIEPVGVKPCRCIRVESEDGLYVTDDFIVTHNTSMGANIGANVARAGIGVLFFSLEMSREEIVERQLSAIARIDGTTLKTGMLSPTQWTSLSNAANAIHSMPFWVDERTGLTVPDIVNVALGAIDEARARKTALGLIIVDYLQKVAVRDDGRRRQRYEIVGDVAKGLKQLARDTGLPVIALAQLRRQGKTENKRRPTMDDLRESGDIEQEADNVVLVHTPEEDDDGRPGAGDGRVKELIIEKARGGRQGIVRVKWTPELTLFDNLPEESGYD